MTLANVLTSLSGDEVKWTGFKAAERAKVT